MQPKKGIVSAGSVPGSAIFFSIYQGIRRQKVENKQLETLKNSFLAPAAGEIGACMIRVPVEVIKQRYIQTLASVQFLLEKKGILLFLFRSQATKTPTKTIIENILKSEGPAGFYRGYISTVCREIPFSFLQFPLWEYLKSVRRAQTNKEQLSFWESGTCGAISGTVSFENFQFETNLIF